MIYYGYSKCSTCRKATQWLADHGIKAELREIRETPPTLAELQFALELSGDIKKLLNTAGAEYREMGLKDQIDAMQAGEVFQLIQQHGNLCKRPFLIDQQQGIALTGFSESAWAKALG